MTGKKSGTLQCIQGLGLAAAVARRAASLCPQTYNRSSYRDAALAPSIRVENILVHLKFYHLRLKPNSLFTLFVHKNLRDFFRNLF